MQELLYSAFDIAYVITQNDMGAKKATDFVNWLWQEEVPFLNQQYAPKYVINLLEFAQLLMLVEQKLLFVLEEY